MSVKVGEYKGYYMELDESGQFEARLIVLVREKKKDGEFDPGSMPEGADRGVTEAGSKMTTYMESAPAAKAKTLEELKKRLDAFSKQKFGQAVLVQETQYGQPKGAFMEGRITSVKEDQGYSGMHRSYRVTFKDGKYTRWEQTSADRLIRDTPENRALLKEVVDLEKDIEALKERQKGAREKLVHYTDEELSGVGQ